MKRILSLVLVLVLALGSVPVAFADNHSAGEMLKEAGFVAGDQDGNLNEDQKLTREQMMVLIAEMNGVKEEAATFSIPFDFTDVNENDWFAPYVWYAAYQGWTAGMGDGSFGAGVAVDSKMAATFMLKALDYEVTDYNASVAQAADMGIEIDEASELTRGQGFKAMWSTVNLPKKDSDVALGVELGRLEPTEEPTADLTAELDTVEAIGNTLVEVYFADDVDAAAAEAADYVVTVKGTSTELDVKDALAVGSDWLYLETAAMKGGESYTLTVGEQSINFTGLAKDSDKPEVDSIKGEDTNVVEVEFDMVVDRATAEDIANYSIDKVGTVVDAELKDDNKTVKLTTEGFDKPQSAKMTVENVLSVDGVAMSKETKTFYTTVDNDAPEIDEVEESKTNNVEVFIYIDDKHGVDKATATDVSNYSIEGLDILKAEVDDVDKDGNDTDYWTQIKLTTSAQDDGKKYELKILNMVDGSTSANAIENEITEKFYGGDEDTKEPSVTDAEALSLTQIAVKFDDKNLLDPATALDISNYEFSKDELTVLDAQFKDDDEEEMVIYLTVSKMDEDESYKLEVNNVADEFGNAMEDVEKETVDSGDITTNAPTYIKAVEYVDTENLKITFNQAVTSATAEDPTNYSVDGDIGTALVAEFAKNSDTVVEVKFAEMKDNKSYKLTVDGVETFDGYATEDATYSFVATTGDQDLTQPEVEGVDNADQGILKVEFSEEMTFVAGTSTVVIRDLDNSNATQTLTAVAASGEDDEIVVFDAVNLEKSASTQNHDFEIVSFSNDITDVAGNQIDYTDGDEEFDTSSSYDSAEFNLEYDDVDQKDILTISMVYDEEVKLLNASNTTVTVYAFADEDKYDEAGASWATKIANATDSEVFKLDIDGDELDLDYQGNSNSAFADDAYVVFKLNGVLGDLVARPVKDQVLEISSWDNNDDDAPVIDEIRAINDRQIEVIYNEDLSKTGSYDVFKGEKDDDELSLEKTEMGDEDNIVLITLKSSDKMEAGEEYTLLQRSTAEDLAGNDAEKEDDGITFYGSSQVFVKDQIDGVILVNGTTLKITDGDDLPTGNYKVYSGSASGTTLVDFDYVEATSTTPASFTVNTNTGLAASNPVDISDADTFVIKLDDWYAMVDGQTFTVVVDATSNTFISDFSESYDGIVEELTFGDSTEVNDTDLDGDVDNNDSVTNDNKIEVVGLEEDTSQTVILYHTSDNWTTVTTHTVTASEQDDEEITYSLSYGDQVKVIVKENGIIKQATDVHVIK